MSFLSTVFSLFVKEAPHIEEDLKVLNNMTKAIRDMITSLKTGRERDAALSALETVAMQGFQAIMAHAGTASTAGKAAAAAETVIASLSAKK